MGTTSFSGRQEFQAAVRDLIQWAAAEGCRTIHAWDASFVDWPLSDLAVLDALMAWARPGRHLQLLALDYEDLARRHPRFVRWRRDFGHCVQARAIDPDVRLDASPQALLLAVTADEKRSLRLLEGPFWRGEISDESTRFQRGIEWFDAVAQRSSDSFASTTLGL